MKLIAKVIFPQAFVALIILLSPPWALALESDDFSQPTFDDQRWTLHDTLGGSTHQQSGGLLTLTLPGGQPRFPGPNGNHAVRLLQPAADEDLEIEIKFESAPGEGTQLQGLVVEQDDGHYILFDFRHTAPGLQVTCTTAVSHFPTIVGMFPVVAADTLYLRLTRLGDRWTGRYSADGQSWVPVFTFTHALAVTKVGFLAGTADPDITTTDRNPDDPAQGEKAAAVPAPPFTVLVDFFFDTVDPIDPEDGLVGTNGLRTFADLQALYLFRSGSGRNVFDFATAAPRLNLQIPASTTVNWLPDGGLAWETPTLLSSLEPAEKVNSACMASGEITLEVWVEPATVDQSGPARMLTVSGDPSHRNATLSQGQWGALPANVYDVRMRTTLTSDNGQPDLVSPAGSLTGQRQHVVFTRDAEGNGRIYIDGLLAATGTYGGSLDNWNPDYPLAIGAEVDGSRSWLGTMHLAAVYSRALDATDVQNHFLAGPDGGVLPAIDPVAALVGLDPGDTFSFDDAVVLVADAADANGTIAKVDFLAGTTLLASSTAAPHQFTWLNPTVGNHQIRAIATDNEGDQGISAVIPILVEIGPGFQLSTFLSDDFADADLGTPWTITDSSGGASEAQSGGHLLVNIPPVAQDPWSTTAQTYFAHQPGDAADLVLEAKLAVADFDGNTFAGLRCEGTAGEAVQFLGQRENGVWLIRWGHKGSGSFRSLGSLPVNPTGDGLWLQMRRTGSDWACYYATDGFSWNLATQMFQPLAPWRTGFVAGSITAGGSPPRAAFDYVFNLADPVIPEDGAEGDFTGPRISGLTVVPTMSEGALTWTTNEPAYFRLAHGPTPAYEAGVLMGEFFTTSHQVTLTDLAAGADHHFQVTCIDTAGNISMTADQFFFTDMAATLATGPAAGSVYRETRLPILDGDDWRITDPQALNPGAAAFLPNPVLAIDVPDLTGAVRAELIIDRWSGHTGTVNKRIRLNGASWLHLPAPAGVPSPSSECYMYQDNLMIDLPLNQLQDGTVTLEGTAGDQVCNSFNWGQWGWYAAILRVYYDGTVASPTGSITAPLTGDTILEAVAVAVATTGDVAEVEILARYDGYDTDGDGVFRQWQRRYRGDKVTDSVPTTGHVGRDDTAPFAVNWDVGWIPDQLPGAVDLQARIRGTDGVWYVTDFVTGLSLEHENRVVRQYRLVDVPAMFWVRNGGSMSATFTIPAGDDLALATSARVTASTWNGIDTGIMGINGAWSVNEIGADHFHAVENFAVPVSALLQGTNALTIAATTVHHGMEMLWPGPVVQVSFGLPGDSLTGDPVGPNGAPPRLAWSPAVATDQGVSLGLDVTGGPDRVRSFAAQVHGPDGIRVRSVTSGLAGRGQLEWSLSDGVLEIAFHGDEPVCVDGRLIDITFDAWTLGAKNALRGQLTFDGAEPLALPATELPLVPTRFQLEPNYPNPFNPLTRIDFALPQAGSVRLRVFDMSGRVVRTLANQVMPPGYHTVDWNGEDDQGRRISSGVYFYRLEAPGYSRTRKMMLIK